jgi:mono/diheme cytochrome c family protein
MMLRKGKIAAFEESEKRKLFCGTKDDAARKLNAIDYGSIKSSRLMRASLTAGAPMVLLGTFLLSASPTLAAGGDDVATGRNLVETHCSRCHATGGAGESPLAAAPKFRDLHLLYDVELLSEALVEGIATAHPDMPQFVFDPLQAEAIIVYLKSLEQ